MGMNPQCKGISINFDCQFEVFLKDCRISTILSAYSALLPHLLMDFFQKVLVGFGKYAMSLERKPFSCKCGNDTEFIWKTRHGKQTKIHGFYCWITLQQLQVQCKSCGSKMYITKSVLSFVPPTKNRRIPFIPKELCCNQCSLTGAGWRIKCCWTEPRLPQEKVF